MKGVILAGGTGSRLDPLTRVTNKHLLPVYDEPMIFKPLRTLICSGISEILIIVGGENIGDFLRLLGSGSFLDISISYRCQDRPGGIAEALAMARDFVCSDDLAVILGDNIFETAFAAEVEAFEADPDHDCYLFLKSISDPERFGVATLDEAGTIVAIEEKPSHPSSDRAVTGFYLYSSAVFEVIDRVEHELGYSSRGELEITDVNNLLIERGRAKAQFVTGFWSDAGTVDTLLRAGKFIAAKCRAAGTRDARAGGR